MPCVVPRPLGMKEPRMWTHERACILAAGIALLASCSGIILLACSLP
jgi:hypothetical protein